MRPEFFNCRIKSLQRRAAGKLEEILVSLGGVDIKNHTAELLIALKTCDLPRTIKITVVMGGAAPHLDEIKNIAKNCPWPVEVLSGISDMAERMTRADLAIGAGGGTSWERCTLGLPTLLIVLAENQIFASQALQASGAVELIDSNKSLGPQLSSLLSKLQSSDVLSEMSLAASKVCDGNGTFNIVKAMESLDLI